MNMEHIGHFRMSLKSDSNRLELRPESTINVFRGEYTHPDILQHLNKLNSNGNSSCQESLCSMWQAHNGIMYMRRLQGILYLKTIQSSCALRVVVIIYFIWRCSTTRSSQNHCILTKPFLRNISWHNNGLHVEKCRVSFSDQLHNFKEGANLSKRLHLDYDTTLMDLFFQKPILWKEAKY